MSQQNTFTDKLNGKASASDLQVLTAEIVAARGDQPSLAVHLGVLNDAYVNADKALGQRIDTTQANINTEKGRVSALSSRMDTAEANINGKAEASTVANLSVKVGGLPRIYRETSAPSGTRNHGDLWYDASNGNRVKRWDVGYNPPQWVDVSDDRITDLLGTTGTLSATYNSLAQTVADLQTGKASASSFEELYAEMADARGTEPTLAGRVATLNLAQIEGDEVNALAISEVKARTDKAEADIITVSNAVSDEAGARAEAVAQVRAAQNVGANAMQNPSGELGLEGWVLNQGWSVDFYEPQGGKFYARYFSDQTLTGVQVFAYRQPWAAKGPVTVSWSAAVVGLNSGSAEFYVEAHDAAGVKLGQSSPKPLHTGDGRQSITLDCPTNTASLLLVAYTVNAAGGPFAQLRLRALKVEAGSTATIFTTDGLARSTAASVTSQSLAIIDLETQQALARFELVAAASGGKPARFRMVSSSLGGSAIALDAAFIYLGDNTVFDDATDTEQTTVGSNIRVIAKGAPFGANGNLLEWWGPSNIALGAMTTANGFNGRMTVAPYVFDNVVVSGGASQSKIAGFSGNIGRTTALNTAGSTASMTVPASGKFIVEVTNAFASSAGEASGLLRLYVSKNGTEEQIGSVSVTGAGDPKPTDLSSLNMEVTHGFAGPVSFVLKANGNGPSTEQTGRVTGTLKATYYP